MDKNGSSQSVRPLLIGLVGLILITIMIISTLGKPAPSGAFLTQTTGMPTPEDDNTAIPDISVTQTRAFLMTQRAVLVATELSATHTPWSTPIIPPTGISTDVQVKFSGEKLGLDVQNAWFGLVGGNSVSVYAGALLDTPDQGAIAIVIVYPYRNFIQKVSTPTRHGQVGVVSEQHNRLTLEAADGAIFYFDVPARRFVGTPDEIVQTATPPPTYTPYAPYSLPTVTAPGGTPYSVPATQETVLP